MEKEQISSGPRVAHSEKKTQGYSKRVIIFFVLLIGILIFAITMQAQNSGDSAREKPEKNYRAPQASGFAELAASMRRDRQPAPSVHPEPEERKSPSREPRVQRIVIEEPRPALPSLPRYYSHKDDAQAANTLRTLKLQALTAKPVVEDFQMESNGEAKRDRGNVGAVGQIGQTPQIMGSEAIAALALAQQNPAMDPNGQLGKQKFLRGSEGGASLTPQGYSDSLPAPQRFPYELKAGTIIPALLLTGVNSDLPGSVIGQVSENVWDTATGKYILIPKGTRILGVYDNQVTFGQRRVLLVWNRLIFPNGTTLDIAGSPGVDQAGYSGLSGKVNEHWGTMLKTALLASAFVAGAEVVYDRDTRSANSSKSPSDAAAESLAGSILDMGTKILNKASDIQPTITVRPGKKMGIFVQKDVVFPFPYF